VNQPTVLILADDAEFARAIMGHWQTERIVPAFTLMSSDLGNHAGTASYELAIIGALQGTRLAKVVEALEPIGRPLIYVGSHAPSVQWLRDRYPRVALLRQHEAWLESLVLVGSEVLRRVEAVNRAQRAEQAAAASKQHAALGRYMLEMRHGFNNALTSVLGNAELLLLDPRELSIPVRDQIDTIHSMALRMHEIMQRFTSLETELQFAEKHSRSGMPEWPRVHAGASSQGPS
jgi:signal transduction histidine kinase